jgi:hypothetical protein
MKNKEEPYLELVGWTLVNKTNKSFPLVKDFIFDFSTNKKAISERLIPTFRMVRIRITFLPD